MQLFTEILLKVVVVSIASAVCELLAAAIFVTPFLEQGATRSSLQRKFTSIDADLWCQCRWWA